MSTSIEMGTKLTMGCPQKVKHPGSEFFLRPPDRGPTNYRENNILYLEIT